MWVLDVDPPKRGDESIREFSESHGPLPRTLTSKTGGGGWHLFFAWPEDGEIRNMTNVAPGLDVRGEGGYVVLPPSSHVSGVSYSWCRDEPVAAAPCWLLDLVRSKQRSSPSPRKPTDADVWVSMLRGGIPEGQRDDSLTRLIGHWIGHGIDVYELAELAYLADAHCCRPPLGRAQVDRILDSIISRDLRRMQEWSR